jgi:rhodanese-related sulfurtransferase
VAWKHLDPDRAQQLLASCETLRVLDVRTEPEYRMHRIPGAQLLPIQALQARVHELDPELPWLVVCEHGMRSEASCQFLHGLGFRELYNLSGGMARWVHEGLPVDR